MSDKFLGKYNISKEENVYWVYLNNKRTNLWSYTQEGAYDHAKKLIDEADLDTPKRGRKWSV